MESMSDESQTGKEQWAWEAAIKPAFQIFEDHMCDNRTQVRNILRRIRAAMFLGFVIIICGAALAYFSAELAASIVVTLSGVLVELIGVTYLFASKSTMEQARGRAGQMLRLDSSSREQSMIWETVLPPELFQMNEELTRVDKLLDDDRFFAPFRERFGTRIGRPTWVRGAGEGGQGQHYVAAFLPPFPERLCAG